MREILFRGKDKENGRWITGFLVSPKHIGDWVTANPVDPRTVGQFTGLTDWNGKKIFEGDIIRAFVNEMEETSELMEFGLSDKLTKVPTGNKIQAFWSVEWKTFSGSVGWRVYGKDRRFNRPFTPNMVFNCKCEVIGNIYDNPELLEKT